MNFSWAKFTNRFSTRRAFLEVCIETFLAWLSRLNCTCCWLLLAMLARSINICLVLMPSYGIDLGLLEYTLLLFLLRAFSNSVIYWLLLKITHLLVIFQCIFMTCLSCWIPTTTRFLCIPAACMTKQLFNISIVLQPIKKWKKIQSSLTNQIG